MAEDTITVRNVGGKKEDLGGTRVGPGEVHEFPISMAGYFRNPRVWEILRCPEQIQRALDAAGRRKPVKQIPQGKVSGPTTSAPGHPRVLLVVDNKDYYSGGCYYLYQIAVALSEAGAQVKILTNRRPVFEHDFDDYDTSRISWMVAPHLQFYPEELRNEVDVVIVAPIEPLIHGLAIARMCRVPCYCAVFDLPNWLEDMGLPADRLVSNQGIREQYRDSLCAADGILAISAECAKYAVAWHPRIDPQKVEIIRPAVNHRVASRASGANGVTYVGRCDWNKGVPALLDAMVSMPGEFPINIVTSSAYGSPPTRYSGTPAHPVVWHLDVGDERKFEILRNSKVVAMPSVFEGYGMVPGEAIYCGVPVVAYDLPVLHEVYGDAIEYVPLRDIDSLVRRVAEIAMGPVNVDGRGDVQTIESMTNDVRELKHVPFKWRHPHDIQFSFVCCVFNGIDWLDEALRSVYDEAHEIIIVEGAVDWWAERYDAPDGKSTDGTHELIRQWVSFDAHARSDGNRIKYHGPMRFPTKGPMRQYAVEQMDRQNVADGKCVYWILDADEAYERRGLQAMRQAIFANQHLKLFQPTMAAYWRDVFHVATGSLWDVLHTKVIVWGPGDHYDVKANRHNEPMDALGRGINISRPEYDPEQGRSLIVNDCVMHHLGHALRNPDTQEIKSDYYRSIDGEHFADRVRPGVTIQDYYGPWPEPVKKLIDRGELTRGSRG